eukprot:UN4526
MVAEKDGRFNANRDEVGDWEKFVMRFLGSAKQRFPNDANFSALWGMHEVKDNDIDAPEAWRKFTGEFSSGIIVAVIDTGIDYTHEDLHDNMWVNPGEIPDNGVDDDGNGFVDDVHGADFANEDGDPMDDQKHGTHCAGTIAGIGNNGIGVTGVSWHGVQLMALKFLTNTGGGKTSDAGNLEAKASTGVYRLWTRQAWKFLPRTGRQVLARAADDAMYDMRFRGNNLISRRPAIDSPSAP